MKASRFLELQFRTSLRHRWLLLVCTLAGASGCMGILRSESLLPPNILFIVADDLGWGDVSWHGSEIRMPYLDELARTGVRLEQHYVMSTCSPTRAGLFGGRFPSRFGCLSPTNRRVFPKGTPTLPSLLKSRGYFTGITGKWHLGSLPKWGPLKHGFVASYGCLAGGVDQYGHWYKDGDYRRTWHENDRWFEEEGHSTDLFAARAARWIRQYEDQPWFIAVTHTAPHIPLQEERRWLRYYDRLIDDPSRRLFASAVTHLDDTVGRLVRVLEETGQRDRTLIVFTSDNGAQRDWFGTDQYAGGHLPCPTLGNNRPLRGWKGQLFEGGIRVPALVNWPTQLKSRTVSEPIHIVDWMPTLLGLAGIAEGQRPKLDGTNLWPILSGTELDLPSRGLYWRTPQARALREAQWKFIIDRGEPFLFDLSLDPMEQVNRASAFPGIVERLNKRIEQFAAEDVEAALSFN